MTFERIDSALRATLTALCSILLAAMVLFTVYTIVARYGFRNPPFWGDTLTMFCNVWMVMLALVLSVRGREHISMTGIEALLGPTVSRALRQFWTLCIVAFGGFLVWYGSIAAWTNPTRFWEFGYMPKTYAMLIMPLAGALIVLAGIVVLAEDSSARRPRQPHGSQARD
jgi:TRAP-type C4-dicarboxylate transport system permease small subunit